MLYLQLKTKLVILCLYLTAFTLPHQLLAITVNPYQICELSTVMRESSGLVANGRAGFWTLNDGNNGPEIHASDTTGNVYRTVELLNGYNYDWEDMTSDEDGNLYLADIGDKNASYSPSQAYDDLSIYKIGNPDYHCDAFVSAEIISFRFPTGSGVNNAEGIFYHDNYLYIVTKMPGQALLYRVPATPSASQYTAEYITSMQFGSPQYLAGAAALSPDGELLVLIGETRMWIISDFTDGVFFDGTVTALDFGIQLQRESVAFIGNREIYITDEAEWNGITDGGFLSYLDLCPYLNEANGCSQNSQVARSRANLYYNTAQETSSGQVSTSSNTINIGNSQLTGLRFDEINIPEGAKITNAYIQFRASSAGSGTAYLTVSGEATGSAATFQTATNNISNRQKTQHLVNWLPASWSSGQAKRAQRTPDLSPVIQEIISQSEWNNFNAIALFIEGTGVRSAFTEASCSDAAPELIIEYYEPLRLNAGVWLDGAYNPQTNSMNTGMNTEQYVLPGQVNTPGGQPYDPAPWNHNGTEGLYYANGNYPTDVVDWLLVSLRTSPQANSTIAQSAVLLRSNGMMMQIEPFRLSERTTGAFYIVVEHRNHMGIMSANPVSINNGVLTYDFRNTDTYKNSTSYGQRQLESGVWGMYGGDADQLSDVQSYDINGSDKVPYSADNGDFYIYSNADFNLDGDVSGGDKEVWVRNQGVSSIVPK